MKTQILKSKLSFNRRISLALLLLITAVIIQSCKKESNVTSPNLDAATAQAKNWYEATYPATVSITTGGKLSTQSINTSTLFNFSNVIKPDWQHNASYTRYGKTVLEIPIVSTSKFSLGLRNAAANKISYNQAYSRSSFILLYDGKNYDAYVMTILADSDYIKSNPKKLGLSTYRKRDPTFTGLVLYFKPDGHYAGGYRYNNGVLDAPAAQNSTKSVNSLKTTTTTPAPVSYCTDWYIDEYQYDVLVSSTYLYTTCDTSISSGTGSSGGNGGTGSNPAPAPVPCVPPTGGGAVVESVSQLKVDQVTPPPTPVGGGDGDGGLPPPAAPQPCVVVIPVSDTISIAFCGGLTKQEQNSIRSTVATFSTEDCSSRFLYSYFGGQTLSFCITPGPYSAIYNSAINSFAFSTDYAATPAFAYLLEHEFFHAYQNATYPGGTNIYGKNATTGANSAGFVNIEFEQAVFNDIATGERKAFTDGTADQKTQYNLWINSLTNSGTVYPQLSQGTTAYNQFINTYNSFLNEFNTIPNNSYTSPIINLTPQALINLFNIVTTPNC